MYICCRNHKYTTNMRQFDINHNEMLAALRGGSFACVHMACIYGWLKKFSLYIPILLVQKHGSLIYNHIVSNDKCITSTRNKKIFIYREIFLNLSAAISKLLNITSKIFIFTFKLQYSTSKIFCVTSNLFRVSSTLFCVTSNLFCVTSKLFSVTSKLLFSNSKIFALLLKLLSFHLKLLLNGLCYTHLNLIGKNFNHVGKFSARLCLDFSQVYTSFVSEQPLFEKEEYFSNRLCFFMHDN